MLAWTRKTPKGGERTNGQMYGLPLPEFDDELGHIAEYLDEIGAARSTGMGAVPVDFAEIQAWAALTRTPLEPSEVTALWSMSTAYAAVLNDTSDACPVQDERTTEAIEMSKLKALIASASK